MWWQLVNYTSCFYHLNILIMKRTKLCLCTFTSTFSRLWSYFFLLYHLQSFYMIVLNVFLIQFKYLLIYSTSKFKCKILIIKILIQIKNILISIFVFNSYKINGKLKSLFHFSFYVILIIWAILDLSKEEKIIPGLILIMIILFFV